MAPPLETAHGVFRRAILWSHVMTGGRLGMTLVVSMVLAHVLGPEAFGTIAMANVLILFLDLIVRQGLVAAIVQRPSLTAAHLDTAFWFTVGAVMLLAPFAIAVSGWWADLTNVPALRMLVIGLSPTLVLKGLGLVQEARIRRTMEFRTLAIRTNGAVLVGGVAGIAAAYLGAGVWALVLQQSLLAVVELVVIWRMSDWRPRRRVSWSCAKDLAGFSGASGLAGIGVFANTRLDALLIGLFFGPVLVGLYRMCIRFLDMSLNLTAGALQSVMLPELSRFTSDRPGMAKRVVEMIRLGTLLAIPGLGVLAAVSEPLMALIGDEWRAAARPLAILCVLGAVQAVSLFAGPILQAAGRPGTHAALVWGAAVVNSASFVLAGFVLAGRDLTSQLMWLALIRTIVFAVTMLATIPLMLRRVIGLEHRAVAAATWPSVAAALCGYGATAVARATGWATWSVTPFIDLAATVAVACAATLLALYVLDPFTRGVVRSRGAALWVERSPRHGSAAPALAPDLSASGTHRGASVP